MKLDMLNSSLIVTFENVDFLILKFAKGSSIYQMV